MCSFPPPWPLSSHLCNRTPAPFRFMDLYPEIRSRILQIILVSYEIELPEEFSCRDDRPDKPATRSIQSGIYANVPLPPQPIPGPPVPPQLFQAVDQARLEASIRMYATPPQELQPGRRSKQRRVLYSRKPLCIVTVPQGQRRPNWQRTSYLEYRGSNLRNNYPYMTTYSLARNVSINMSILVVCRQLYHEAARVFYGENVFYATTVEGLAAFLKDRGPVARLNIRYLSIPYASLATHWQGSTVLSKDDVGAWNMLWSLLFGGEHLLPRLAIFDLRVDIRLLDAYYANAEPFYYSESQFEQFAQIRNPYVLTVSCWRYDQDLHQFVVYSYHRLEKHLREMIRGVFTKSFIRHLSGDLA